MTEWLHSKLIDESSSFCKSVVRHLEGNQAGLYSSSEAFSRFIDGGGNVPLYERAVDHAQQLITSEFGSDMTRMSLLDLGAGTGKLLIPLLSRLQHVKELRIVLVDAEEGMMKGLKEKVLECRPDADVVTLVANFVDFVNSEDEEFDVCISSFALHYCPVGDDRTMVLKWIYENVDLFLLFEFDVDDKLLNRDVRDEERLKSLLAKYERGCAEYDGDPDSIVRDGFLAPVFCLNFKDDAVANEISLASWTRLLLDAGFEDLGSNLVYAYWWANCFVLRARSNANFDRRCYVSLQMEVADYGKKGRGYRAVCDVEPGTLLLSERPMIVRNSDVSKYRAIGKIIMAKLAYDSETALRFYQFKSIFNHSCIPNCALIDNRVVCIRKVEKQEELCISYISGVLHSIRTCVFMLPNKYRAKHLEKIFGFTCLCSRCANADADFVSLQTSLDLPDLTPVNCLECDDATKLEIEHLVAKNEEGYFALLPFLVVWTMQRHWIERCLIWFQRCFPENFPATNKLKDFLHSLK